MKQFDLRIVGEHTHDLPPGVERLGWLPTVWVHRFVQPDGDAELHNHPWGWALSVVLRGAYTEERLGWPERVVRRFNVITGDTWHRVAKLHGGEVWTLFMTGQPRRSWGFLASARVVPWRDHVDARDHASAHTAPTKAG